MKRVLLLFLLVSAIDAVSQPFFPCTERMEEPFGVCSHITRRNFDYEIRDRELSLTKQVGIQWIRSDLDFYNAFHSHTEFDPAFFDSVVASTETYGQHLLGILTWLGQKPWDDSNYAFYLKQLARQYDGKITHWEMLNEVNLMRGVDNLCSRYLGVLKLAYETLKQINPSNTVLTSGFAELPEPFISDFSSSGGWRYCDVFNFHSYFAPEGLIPCFERLHSFMKRDGWSRPVWLTECGMHTALMENESSGFFTNLLPAALNRIGIRMNKAQVGVLHDVSTGYLALFEDEVDVLVRPFCRKIKFCSLPELESLSVGKVPVLITARDEYFPATYFPALVDYVRRGGTIVLAGGMPFYYDAYTSENTYFNRKTLGQSLYKQLHMSGVSQRRDPITNEELTETPSCWGRSGEISSTYEWEPTAKSPARYLGENHLAEGDTLIPLITAGTEHLRYSIAGIYRLRSDLQGNIIFQTRMYAPLSADKEAEQARRVARLYLIAFAYGVDKVFWYNLRSREKDLNYSEDCFGLIHKDFTEKPSMQAYRTLVKMCPEGSTRPRIQCNSGLYRATWEQPNGNRVEALWSPIARQEVKFAGGRRVSFYDYLGNRLSKRGNKLVIGTGVTYCLQAKE